MIKEESIGHEIASIQDDGWEHVEEEYVGCQWGGTVATLKENKADDKSNNDEKTRFREKGR